MTAEGEYEPLRLEHEADLENRRSWVREHYPPDALDKYNSVDGKLFVIKVILERNWIGREEIGKFQCLGVALGDAIAQTINMEWVTVDDEHGCEAVLRCDGDDEGVESVFVPPMNLIWKRVERGEAIDVFHLYENICQVVLTRRERPAGRG